MKKERKDIAKRVLTVLMAIMMVITFMPLGQLGVEKADAATASCPVTVKLGTETLTVTDTGKTVSTSWNGDAELYEVEVPVSEGTIELSGYTNAATGNTFLAYNYTDDADNGWLEGSYENDGKTGVSTREVKTDANNDGTGDYIHVQTPYTDDWQSGLVCVIRIVLRTPFDFSFVKNNVETSGGTKAAVEYKKGGYTGYGTLDLYTITVPDDISSVKLSFGTQSSAHGDKCRLLYNYDKNGNYLSGSYSYDHEGNYQAKYDEYTEGDHLYKCSAEKTVDIDSNKDGVMDYVLVQEPYTFINDSNKWYSEGGEALYAVTFRYEDKESGSTSALNGPLPLSNTCKDTASYGEESGKLRFVYGPMDNTTYVTTIADPEVNYDIANEASTLGNRWYKGNELTNTKDADTASWGWNYLSAMTEIPAGTELKNLTVTWYYGDKYKENGGYANSVTAATSPYLTEGTSYDQQTKGSANGCTYQNTNMPASAYYVKGGNEIGYYNFQLYPSTAKAGTFYYYVVIEYDEGYNHHVLSSVKCQAVVKITDTSAPPAPADDKFSVYFTMEGFGSLSGIGKHSVSVVSGTKAIDLVKDELAKYGYGSEWKSTSGGYLVGVSKGSVNYEEFTAGPNSGWMYRVNGEAPNYGMGYCSLKSGDDVVLYYTGDYTKDPYARASMGEVTKTVAEATAASTDNGTTTAGTEVKVKGTIATATVSQDQANDIAKQSEEGKAENVVIKAEANSNVDTTNIQIPVSLFKDISNKTESRLTIDTDQGALMLDKKTVDQISEKLAGTVIITVKTYSANYSQKKIAGDSAQIVEITISAGGVKLSDLNEGAVTLKTELPKALNGKKVAAVCIGDDGKLEVLPSELITEGTKKLISFITPHLSTFAIVDIEEAGLPEEDAADISSTEKITNGVKATTVTATVKTVTKNGEKCVKISWTKSKGYKVDCYQIYRSTKKASGFKKVYTTKSGKAKSYTTSKNIKAGNTYYYKVRGVRTVDGKKVYTKWSKVKQVKVK